MPQATVAEIELRDSACRNSFSNCWDSRKAGPFVRYFAKKSVFTLGRRRPIEQSCVLGRIVIHDQVLDANPGRPGAPISIPGLPIEAASGGIKAPQYFAPGVAGDHGEPIAQYFQIGDFLYPNNLPANAHGNGYADPNFLIPPTIEAVTVDGGAFNVRQGNNSVDLAASYVPRERFNSFVQITGDYRDGDVMAGWSPSNPKTNAWLALEASFGNGFLERLENRQQYKLNGLRQFILGRHALTLFGIGQKLLPTRAILFRSNALLAFL
jgi:hypothetical protein